MVVVKGCGGRICVSVWIFGFNIVAYTAAAQILTLTFMVLMSKENTSVVDVAVSENGVKDTVVVGLL